MSLISITIEIINRKHDCMEQPQKTKQYPHSKKIKTFGVYGSVCAISHSIERWIEYQETGWPHWMCMLYSTSGIGRHLIYQKCYSIQNYNDSNILNLHTAQLNVLNRHLIVSQSEYRTCVSHKWKLQFSVFWVINKFITPQSMMVCWK